MEDNTLKSKLAIGIDLGTTYSCIGVWRNKKVEIISNPLNNNTTPSMIAFTDKKILIGENAKNRITKNYQNTVYDVKRLIGRNFNDKEVQEDMKYYTFDLEKDEKNKPMININNKKYYPEELSALILEELKKYTEIYLNKKIENVVITVPAYFNQNQKNATIKAGEIAGFKKIDLMSEPNAAAITYGLEKKSKEKRNICIFDFGGGTFDVTILEIENMVFKNKAIGGDSHLGGEDLDNELVKYCIKKFKESTGIDISINKKAINRLKIACESAKKDLSQMLTTNIDIDSLVENEDFNLSVQRSDFINLCDKYFIKCIEILEHTIEDSGLKKDNIENVVLAGGSSRIPEIQKKIIEFFQRENILLNVINADEAIAYGAAIKAAQNLIINNSDNNYVDKDYEFFQELKIIDINPLSIGIATQYGFFCPFIEKNTEIPCKKEKRFKTTLDDQENFCIAVYEGERIFCKDNIQLGYYKLNHIRKAKKGEVIIKITFELNKKDCLFIKLEEEGRRNLIETEVNREKINDLDYIEGMVNQAKVKLEEDIDKRKSIELKVNILKLLNQLTINNENINKNKINEYKKWLNDHPNESLNVYNDKKKEIENLISKSNKL